MDRRIALKNMGLALGYTVAIPSLISIVQSCKNETVLEWTPAFFTQEEGAVLTHLVDIIIPKTDTPSASEVKADIFIDRFANEVMEKQQQDFFKMSMRNFIKKALADSGEENAANLTPEDLEPILAASLKNSKEDQIKMFETINEYQQAVAEGKAETLDENIARFAFANNLRGMTIWAYKTSEYVGEEVLVYLPVPGEYIPCGDLNELTQGKAWSI